MLPIKARAIMLYVIINTRKTPLIHYELSLKYQVPRQVHWVPLIHCHPDIDD